MPPPPSKQDRSPGAIEPQTFADESDRARLSEVALKAFLALGQGVGLVERARPPLFSEFPRARSTA